MVLGSETATIKYREHTTSGNSAQDVRKFFGGQAEDVSLTLHKASEIVLNKRMESALHASIVYFIILIQLRHDKRRAKTKTKTTQRIINCPKGLKG